MSGDGWRNRITGYGEADPAELVANPRNWRAHPQAQQAAMDGVLSELGWIDDVTVNKRTGFILDGHLRVALALKRGARAIPVKYVELDETEEALALATLDPIGAMAAADADRLGDLLADVQTGDAALQAMLAGLAAQNKLMFGPEPPEDPGPQLDRAAELQEKWQVQPGQVWRCDEHLVICGDCRESEIWARLLQAAGAEKVNGVFTSPPYAEQRKEQYGGVPVDQYVDWWEAVQANVRASLTGDGSFFVNIKPHCEDGERVLYVFDLVLAMRRRWGWRFRDEFIWKHDGFPGEYKYRHRNQFEPIYHFSESHHLKHNPLAVGHKSSMIRDNSGGKRMAPTNADNDKDAGKSLPFKSGIAQVGNVIECAPNSSTTGHAAVFPVALPTFFIRAYSDEGDVWVDPFLGSGTAIVAAHQTGRRGLGIELLDKYVAVTLERLSGLTGREPRLVNA
jgi:DNA modification methylase